MNDSGKGLYMFAGKTYAKNKRSERDQTVYFVAYSSL